MKSTPLIAALLLLFVSPLWAASTAAKHEHKGKHTLIGSHGMVLIQDQAGQRYASHMPLYYSPHDYQVIYKVEVSDSSKVDALFQQGLVSVLPDVFDLSILIKGQPLNIDAVFYQGHFERGGQQMHKQTLRFIAPVYIKPLESNIQPLVKPYAQQNADLSIQSSTKTQHSWFDIVPVSEAESLYVHRIQSAPSFDVIGFIAKGEHDTLIKSCAKVTSISAPNILAMLKKCQLAKPNYLEYKDFK